MVNISHAEMSEYWPYIDAEGDDLISGVSEVVGVSDVQTRWGQQHGADVTVRRLMEVVTTQFLVIEFLMKR